MLPVTISASYALEKHVSVMASTYSVFGSVNQHLEEVSLDHLFLHLLITFASMASPARIITTSRAACLPMHGPCLNIPGPFQSHGVLGELNEAL